MVDIVGKIYRKKPDKIYAIQYVGGDENYGEIVKFIEPLQDNLQRYQPKEHLEHLVMVNSGTATKIFIGYWFIMNMDMTIQVCTPKTFKRLYSYDPADELELEDDKMDLQALKLKKSKATEEGE